MKPFRRRSFGLGCESLESRDTPSADAVVATGAAVGDAPYVTVYDSTGTQLAHFLAYDASYTGGVNVTLGDVNKDGFQDIITAPKTGVANIRVYDGVSFKLLNSFNAFDAGFTGGASVSVGSLYTDGSGPSIIVGAGAGGGPNVRVFDGMTDNLVKSFYAFDPSFRGGVNVASISVQPTVIPLVMIPGQPPPVYPPPPPGKIVAAAGSGGGPQVTIFSADTLAVDQSFYAYDPSFRGGVNVVADSSGRIITGAGVGGSSNVRVYSDQYVANVGFSYSLLDSIYAGSSSDTGGVSVGTAVGDILAVVNPLSTQSTTQAYDFVLVPNPDGQAGSVYRLKSTIFGQNSSASPPIPGFSSWGHIGSFPT